MVKRIYSAVKGLWQIKPQYPPQGRAAFIVGISNSLSRMPDGTVQASKNTEAVTNKCVELYSKWSRRILFSGCFGESEFGVSEKSEMKRIALEQGVEKRDIFLESTLPPSHGTLYQPVPVLKEIKKANALEEARDQGVIVVFHPLQSRRGTAIFKHWFSKEGIPVYPVLSDFTVNERGRAVTQPWFRYGEGFYFFYEIGMYLDFKLTGGLLSKILSKLMPPLE